jgi:pyruvate,water dikinase
VVDQLAGPWDEVRARLSGSAEGRRFLDAFAAFLARHGHHARGECDLSVPRWAEEPAYVLRLIQGAAGQAGPAAAAEERRQARERLLAELRPRLGPLRHRLLVAVADRAARGAAARETGRSEAIRRASLARWTVLEIGRRLRERGLLAEADDVFFLHLAEVPEALAGADLRPRIGERRAEHQRHLALSPPPIVIGQWQPEADPAPAPPPQGVLRGIAASPGIVEGPARLVLRADDEVVVRPGEVLVAPFTDPGWTPYFLSAAGVVMDFGGMLSHGSVIAREYGLPAVVNVGQATRQIRTGQRVRVDGDTGTVTIFP